MRYGGLIAAVVFAVIAAILVIKFAGDGSSKTGPVQAGQGETKTINVYVAAKPISVGTALTAEMVATQPWPAHLAVEGFVQADGKTDVVGMVTRGSLQQGEPLMQSKLANPNDPNFLAGDLPKGMRVVTIPVNEVNGVAGFVFPGDHVDVIFTHEVDKIIAEQQSQVVGGEVETIAVPRKVQKTVAETLLTNVKVLAVDQRASNEGATDEKGKLKIPKSASLMVSQADAQRLRLAEKVGTLSVVLRSLADKESVDPLTVTQETDVSQSEGGSEEFNIGKKIIIRHGQKKEVQSIQGGSFHGAGGRPAAGLSAPAAVSAPVVSVPSGNNPTNPALLAIP